MSIVRVTPDGIEIEYQESNSGITVLHKVFERDGEAIVEDYFKGRDGSFKRTKETDGIDDGNPNPEPSPEPEPEPAKRTIKVLGREFTVNEQE